MTIKKTTKFNTTIGVIFGAVIGAVAYLSIAGPVVNLTMIALALSGGSLLGGLLGHQNANKDVFPNLDQDQNGIRIPLKQEYLDIMRNKISIGDVKIHKEVITEEKTITIPLTREDVVIESRKTDGNHNIKNPKTIRIPVCEEKLKITKIPVPLNDVSIFKQDIKETKHIHIALKKEIVQVEHSEGKVATVNNHRPQD